MDNDVLPSHERWAASYCYVRAAMVGLLIALGAAVIYQTGRQHWHLLGSVSAYYYTAAQAIFVGALIGLGACMIALKGTNAVEFVFLNLGGMFATVVAVVPTARGEDYKGAIRACTQSAGPLLTQRAATGPSCPTPTALVDATRANVENNMVALLVVGAVGLIVAGLLALRWRGPASQRFWWGFGSAAVVWAVTGTAFLGWTGWFAAHAHFIAAFCLFLCVLVVVMANAFHKRDQRVGGDTAPQRLMHAVGQSAVLLARPGPRNPYPWLAGLMLLAAVAGTALVLTHQITLFWLEIAVALLFAVFWSIQTFLEAPQRNGHLLATGAATAVPTIAGRR